MSQYRYQRIIYLEQLRFEQLKNIATRCSALAARDAQTRAANSHPAFRAIEQVLQELFILQKKYMLYLSPSEVDLPLVRMLLKLSFTTRGKAKVDALVQELQEHNDRLEHILMLCSHPHCPRCPRSRDHDIYSAWQNISAETAIPRANSNQTSANQTANPPSLVGPQTGATGYHMQTASHTRLHAAAAAADSSHSREHGFPPMRTVAPSQLSHQPTQFPSYSSQSSHQSHQASPTEAVGRPMSIPYIHTYAGSPTPPNLAKTSWFGSNGSYISRERDDNCSGPLHREYSSSSSRDSE